MTGTADRGAGGGGAGGPHFSPQMQLLMLQNPAKLPEMQLKFDDQIAGNRTFKVTVFKTSRGQFTRTPLNGYRAFG